MASKPPTLTTFERSCQHWSEHGQEGMDAFYRLASKDYRLLATELDWQRLFRLLRERFGDTIELLDVACGSGQFPAALLEYAGLGDVSAVNPELHVHYALLDPSRFSIETARAKLQAPFFAGQEWQCTAQDLREPESKYAIHWATHALYCVPPAELKLALQRMQAASEPSGLGFIAHASQSAHYLKFQDLYLRSACCAGQPEPYCTAEQVVTGLKALPQSEGLWHYAIDYEGTIELSDRQTAERYLQRCLFDDDLTLDVMLADELLGPYLQTCMDQAAGVWRFKQQTFLIFYGGLADSVRALVRTPV